jgi:hypothetical protein
MFPSHSWIRFYEKWWGQLQTNELKLAYDHIHALSFASVRQPWLSFPFVLCHSVHLTLHLMNWTCNSLSHWCVQYALNFWWVIMQKRRLFVYSCGCWITHYNMKPSLHNRSDDWALGDSRFRMRGICLLLITKLVTSVMPGTSEFNVIILKYFVLYFLIS